MISQYDVYSFLATELPQLAENEYPSRPSLHIYASINYFADYTKHAVENHNFSQAKKCFAMAENLYLNGDVMVRFLIENSFVYSVFSFVSERHTDKLVIKSIIPETLLTVYLKQLRQNKSNSNFLN